MFFSRTRRGEIKVSLPDDVAALLGRLLAELRALLMSDDDERLRRLYPTAYPDDAERDAEYQRLMHNDLLESRLAALDTVQTSLGAERVDDEQLAAWMQATNSLRLILGTQLDVSETPIEIDQDDPDAGAYALYDLLTFLIGEMVGVAATGQPGNRRR